MVTQQLKKKQPAAKANVCGPMHHELINRTLDLLRRHKEIKITEFSNLWLFLFDEYFDTSRYFGYDAGLPEFFIKVAETANLNIIKKGEDRFLRLPKDLEIDASIDTSATQINYISAKKHFIFKPEHVTLWHEKKKYHLLLMRDDILVASTPLENLRRRNLQGAEEAISMIGYILSGFKDGLAVHQISERLSINKRLFNVTSINELVTLYPEIFYTINNEEGDCLKVYDGKTTTSKEISYNRLKLRETLREQGYQPEIIASTCIVFGIYQMTCILITVAGPNGLSLSAWRGSLTSNFSNMLASRKEINQLLSLRPLQIMNALQSFGLIEIRSGPEFANDLRLYLPIKEFDVDSDILLLAKQGEEYAAEINDKDGDCRFYRPISSSDYQTASTSIESINNDDDNNNTDI